MNDIMTCRGQREIWLELVHKAKKENKKLWEVLSPFLKKYAATNQETRSHLKKTEVELLSNRVVPYQGNYRHDIHIERQAA